MDHNPPPGALATAGDAMTAVVIVVAPETSVAEAARLMLKHRISAVPVADSAGALLGMVSEGDLMGRSSEDRLSGQEWWLAILAKPGQMDVSAPNAALARPVRDVMHRPVVTVEAGTPVGQVAELLRGQGIKRVPVMRDGRMAGIVSRADLLRVVEATPEAHGSPTSRLGEMLAGFFSGTGGTPSAPGRPVSPAASPAPITAGSFREMVGAFDKGKLNEKAALAHAAELDRVQQVKTMLQDHVGSEMWATLMTHARVAAANGEKEMELFRFPAGLCSDDGRKINNADPAWADTLRGEAAEIHARWERELKSAGFGLAARVVGYREGVPGDVALVLVWES